MKLARRCRAFYELATSARVLATPTYAVIVRGGVLSRPLLLFCPPSRLWPPQAKLKHSANANARPIWLLGVEFCRAVRRSMVGWNIGSATYCAIDPCTELPSNPPLTSGEAS